MKQISSSNRQLISVKKVSAKPTARYLTRAKQKIEKVGYYLGNLAAKQPNISSRVGGDQTRVKGTVNIELKFTRWTQTQFQKVNYIVAPCLLDV